MSILLKNGKVWDGEQFSYKDIFIEEGIVRKFAEDINVSADFVYDATGKIVSPGLVDVHVHMRGISTECYGIQAEMSCFPFGVTAANDAWGMYGNRALSDSFMLKNTIFAIVEIIDNHARFGFVEEMIRQHGDRVIGIKVCFETNAQTRDITPLREACEYASEHELKVMVHCNNSPTRMRDIIETLKTGDILTHAFHGGNNNALEDDFESIKLAKQKGIYIDAGMAANVHINFEVFKKAIEQGILPDIISTDITKNSAYQKGGRYGMTMCMSIAKELGMREEDIFRVVTSNPAKALGKKDKWGCLREGGCADIAVYDYTDVCFDLTDNTGNRLKSTRGYACVLTVSDGEMVYRGELHESII